MNRMLENITFDELQIGQQAELVRTLTKDDIILFATMSGNINPAHLDPVFAETIFFMVLLVMECGQELLFRICSEQCSLDLERFM